MSAANSHHAVARGRGPAKIRKLIHYRASRPHERTLKRTGLSSHVPYTTKPIPKVRQRSTRAQSAVETANYLTKRQPKNRRIGRIGAI